MKQLISTIYFTSKDENQKKVQDFKFAGDQNEENTRYNLKLMKFKLREQFNWINKLTNSQENFEKVKQNNQLYENGLLQYQREFNASALYQTIQKLKASVEILIKSQLN